MKDNENSIFNQFNNDPARFGHLLTVFVGVGMNFRMEILTPTKCSSTSFLFSSLFQDNHWVLKEKLGLSWWKQEDTMAVL